jgi:hypothetical protein
MREQNHPIYPEELSQFLMAQAALRDSQPANTMNVNTDSPAIKPMPPDFELAHPRRVRWSGWHRQPDGSEAHIMGTTQATAEQEAWYRINDPEDGLHPDDLAAFRVSKRGPVARFFARLKFWS